MIKSSALAVIAAMLLGISPVSIASAAEVTPGAETGVVDGPVWEGWFARVDEEKFESYKKFLGKDYRLVLDAWKKAGLISEYKIITSMSRSPEDWNLAILLKHKNMAEMDVPGEIWDEVEDKALERVTDPELLKLKSDKNSWRRVIGSRLFRELVWK